jgi:uncharacterized protein YceH (UPF0502 family)
MNDLVEAPGDGRPFGARVDQVSAQRFCNTPVRANQFHRPVRLICLLLLRGAQRR